MTRRRGTAIVAVLWGLVITALLVSTMQVWTMRMAMLGRDTHERIRARWAARAGAESTIARLAYHTANPVPGDAHALSTDLEAVHFGEIDGGSWIIQHHAGEATRPFAGPMDEHSKLNVNGPNRGYIDIMFGPLAWGVFAAIEDWIDEDDEPSEFGVEREYYLSLKSRYEPRNGPMQSVAELELVAGIEPDDIRGEDFNLNARLDPEEDDGDEILPWDDQSGSLDAGWSGRLTVRSQAGGATLSGQPRIWLMATDQAELIERFDHFGLTLPEEKATWLVGQGASTDFDPLSLVTALEEATTTGGQSEGDGEANLTFTPDEVAIILSETSMKPAHRPDWGRMNLNTIPADTLYDMFEGQERMVDSLLALRAGRATGLVSPVDLWDLPGMDSSRMDQLLPMFGTHSNVFTISSRGESAATGEMAEINLVVDRSTLPIRILEYREN